MITATFSGTPGTTNLTVTGATLKYITVTADKKSIADGTKLQFTATGVYTDNTTQDLTNDPLLTWGSSSTTVAAFLSAGDPAGMITAQSPGSTNITASISSPSVTSPAYALTVTNATLSSIIITPADPVAYVIAYGTTQQFTATGVFSDNTTQDLTNLVDWSSSNTSIANIDENGLATTADAGTSAIWAKYPKDGPYTVDKDSTLLVVFLTLNSIEVTPTTKSTWVGQTVQYTAIGTYDGGYTQDLTNQVLWVSSTSAATISNSDGSKGLATALSAGSSNITAIRGGKTSNTAVLTVAASDTVAPTMISAQLLSGNRVRVTFSEPMDYVSATNINNYKVMTTANVGSEICDDNGNFTDTGASMVINSVDFYSQSVYILNLGEGTNSTQYTVIGNKAAIKDVAASPNALACPNTATFNGVDTVKPYLVSVVNSEPTEVIVRYSEPMTTGGGTSAADNMTNYTLVEDPSDGNDTNNISITSITRIDDSTFVLNLNQTAQSLQYKLTINALVTDQAPEPNTMGTPRILTFQGKEQLKVISAVATDLYHVKVTFSRPVSTTTAECSGAIDCHTKYKLFPRSGTDPYPALLGDITSAVRGTGEETNTVTLTHVTKQEGIAYVVAAANAKNGDGFDNGTTRIESAASASDYVQAAPKDRATFIGLGEVIDNISDGEYFSDPFADGSSFSWSFTYGGRVYLGTNDDNNAAFRFDPDGNNSVLVNFNYAEVTGATCTSTKGFGYIASTITTAPVCPDNSGPKGEVGVVGFNSVALTVDTTQYELLITGSLKNSVSDIYYTQDLDTDLNWKNATITGGNGTNTKSIQTIYGTENYVFIGISSDHQTNLPVFNRYTATQTGGVITLGSVCDMAGADITLIGDPVLNDQTAGIDAMIKFGTNLYIANNGGVVRASNYGAACDNKIDEIWTNATPSSITGTTLVLPDSNLTTGGGLGKISPGQRGVPKFLVYNSKLYMARNVAQDATNSRTPLRGELWVCTDADADGCEPSEWSLIISGTESDLTATSISLLQNNGSGKLYVGFDSPGGVTVWRIASTNPEPTSTHGNRMDFNDADPNTGWVKQGTAGLGNSHTTIYSSATINDGTYDYIYLTAGGGGLPIKVYRQRE